MAQLRSPGVVIKEKDLTNGRASIASANVAAFVGPFPKGELGSPVLIDSRGLGDVYKRQVHNCSWRNF